MEMGCGLATKLVHGRRHLYVWSYERRSGRSVKVERYVGPVGKAGTGERAVRMLLERAEGARAEVNVRISRYKRALERMRRA